MKPKVPVTLYVPTKREEPANRLEISSAWRGIETILADLMTRFGVRGDKCLEFGVEYGYSTVALSSYFKSVTGVDTFQGDRHTNIKDDTYEKAKENCAPYPNIKLVRSDYASYQPTDPNVYDLIHVDIIHTFQDTYQCGLWSAQRAVCTIFHDTESFPQVKQACKEVARKTGKRFHNYEQSYGLGIVV